jgi:hypothetical protein
VKRWWHAGPPHLRRRRRLLVWSAPAVLLVVAAIVTLSSMVIAGHSAASNLAAGNQAVRDGRLDEAERHFSDAAESGGAQSCPASVNLELVRETLGDKAVGASDGPGALTRYRAARSVVTAAPAGCFAGNDDADAERRDVRARSAERLDAKIALLEAPLPPPPPVSAPPPPPPPASASGSRPSPADTPDERQLNPGSTDPLDRLRQLLEDGAATRN